MESWVFRTYNSLSLTYNLTLVKKSSTNPWLFSSEDFFIGNTRKMLLSTPPPTHLSHLLFHSPGIGR